MKQNQIDSRKNRILPVERETTLLPFLLESISGKSRNNIKSILKHKQVIIDGRPVSQFNFPLTPGQLVEVPVSESGKKVGVLPFPVVYEDGEIIVISKPAGMLSISTASEKERTAYHILTEYLRSAGSAERLFIVHRLDRETSGLILFAKNEDIKRRLQENWAELVTHRGYIALVEGRVEKSSGVIRSWLKQTKTLLVYSSDKPGGGKEAVTRYTLICASDSLSLLSVSLETGRKNQIRVHMKDIGHPVVGDGKYGSVTNPISRLGLHANLLVLNHPVTGKELRFESPYPPQFKSAVRK
ncbi:MAG: RluA family pseudouridine synthase [Oscillospiraceae bacterium]|jgi:RluA family pseudouridine synthase|nr:RluA family pseudouridine synthase [Oscillospiraceae bacterium]